MYSFVSLFRSSLITLVIVALTCCAPPERASVPGPPITIPSVKQWTGGPGSYSFSSSSRIVLDPADVSKLNTTAYVFANDLSYLSCLSTPVVAGNTNAGDILLTLNSTDTTLGTDGYSIIITDRVTISAQADAGAFYGTRTLLQLLKQNFIISGGTIRDWPDYPQRGLMVDVGRKYFSVQWLENLIRDLSYQKLGYLHLHFSDNLGFRIESSSHPELTSNTSPYYTKAQMSSLIALAQQYHVTIVPEIDFPAHVGAILAVHPELKLVSSRGIALPDKIDLSLPGTYTLISDLLHEYLTFFPGPYWHAGADEYLHPGDYADYPQLQAYAQAHWGPGATGVDTYLNYVNWVDSIVKSYGKTTRTWGDPYESLASTGTAVGLNKDVVLELWNGDINPWQPINSGFYVSNASFQPLYYVLGSYLSDPQNLYEDWAPNLEFGAGNNWSVAPRDPRLLGAKLHIWCDNPDAETEDQVAAGIMNALRGVAQNSWQAPKLVPTYSQFTSLISVIGRAPGWGIAGGPVTSGPSPNGGPSAPSGLVARPASSNLTVIPFEGGRPVKVLDIPGD
jgi:hexosaminidase